MLLSLINILLLTGGTFASSFFIIQNQSDLSSVIVIAMLPFCLNITLASLQRGSLTTDRIVLLDIFAYHAVLSNIIVSIVIFYYVQPPSVISFATIALLFVLGVVYEQLMQSVKLPTESDQVISDLVDEVMLRSSREETILRSIANGVILLDPNGTIFFSNPAINQLFGKDNINFEGNRFESFCLLWDLHTNRPINLTNELAENQSITINRAKIMAANDIERVVNLSAATIYDSAEVMLGYVLVMVDMTKEIELEKMRLDFVSIASHELRTPLTSLNGYLSLLATGSLPPEDQKVYLHRAHSSSERLSKLVRNILNISRVEQNRLKLSYQSFDLVGLIKEEVKNLNFQIANKGLTINFTNQTGQGSLQLHSDPGLIEEVLMNLLDNAIKYSKDHGTIEIIVSTIDATTTKIAVKDNGIGVPKKHQKFLFRQFYRAENILEEESQGAGLGLFITRRLIEILGGEIGFESQEGIGSTFWFTIVTDEVAKTEESVAA